MKILDPSSPARSLDPGPKRLRSLNHQHVLQHNDIKTSVRYLHMADDIERSKYDQYFGPI